MSTKGVKLSAATIAKMKAAVRPKATVAERFWPKVRKTPTCWIWTGAVCEGYGNILYLDKKCTTAHRVSLILAGIDVPADMVVDHICRNKLCVRPDHLRVVTHKVNAVENNLSPLALNAQKTHCIRGHSFTPENTRMVFNPASEREILSFHQQERNDMPFEISPGFQPTITKPARVGRYQECADAMLRGCSWTSPGKGWLINERLSWLPFVKPQACALGAMQLGYGGEFPEIAHRVWAAYLNKYGTHIEGDNDSGAFTREQIAARIAAL